jgi:hypothetical protein
MNEAQSTRGVLERTWRAASERGTSCAWAFFERDEGILVAPTIFALSYSLINLMTSDESGSFLVAVSTGFLMCVVTVQLIVMVAFEAFVLKDKLFIER